jgi:hypothetical protein
VGYFDDVKKADPPPTSGRLTVVTSSSGTSSYAAAALRGEAGDVASAPEGARNDRLNKAWFNMGRHIGAGSIDVESVKIALTQAGQAAGLPDHEIETVLRDGSTSALNAGAANPRIPAPLPDLPTPTVFEVPDLSSTEEAAFWSARDILTHVHTFARARMVAPWAVLGVTLARIITATPHQVCLPPIVGGKASLNLFVGLVGPSGSGKGAAEAVAAEAVNVGYIESHNVGSGEGIAHGYKHRSKGELHWNDDHHAVMFSVPEIDSLAAQGDRKGATLMPQLRSGWTGEQLGFGYADPMKRIIVEAHQYRLCLVAGIQPARAGCLLDDADGGTPQRFLWMPATDADAPDQEPAAPAPLTWQAPSVSDLAVIGGTRIDVCHAARTVIKENRRARNRGDGDALDGHALLAQLKTAAALGIAEGRYSVTDEDWELAGVISRKSAAVRSGIAEMLRVKARQINHGRAEAEATRTLIVAEAVTDAAVKKVCQGIVRRLRTEGDWVSASVVRKVIPARAREHFEAAIERLLEAGQIEIEQVDKGRHLRLTQNT